MNDSQKLVDQMSTLYDLLMTDGITREKADSLANIAGKKISIHKLHLAYQTARKEKPEMTFFDKPKED